MNWKDLDRTAPIAVVLNMSKYQIQLLSNGKWIDTEIVDELDLLAKLIPGMVKYRYRLKPLKSCVITEHMARDLRARVDNGSYDSLEDRYGHTVEIIGDDE